MSITKLISQGKAYEELFDAATYIQTDDGVGIYPAYENALRSAGGIVNSVSTNIQEGSFIINVPTGTSSFLIPLTTLKGGFYYTLHYETSIALDYMIAQGSTTGTNRRFTISTPILKDSFDFVVQDDGESTSFFLAPLTADLNRDILIKYTIVPQGYPNQQEGEAGALNAYLSNSSVSQSFQLNNVSALSGATQVVARFYHDNTPNDALRIYKEATPSSTDNLLLRLSNSTTQVDVRIKFDDNSIFTLTKNGGSLLLYKNKDILSSVLSEDGYFTRTTFISNSQGTFNIKSLLTSTEESTGYTQGTEPSIIPTCKLGLTGEEIDLPTKSRTINSDNRIVKKLESESANATPHTQYIAQKERYTINYDVISSTDKKTIRDIEALQWENNTRLSYIYNEESGNLITKTVRAEVTSGGQQVRKDRYFDNGLTLELKE